MLILITSTGAYFAINANLQEAKTPVNGEETQTATVRRGDIILLASGTGVVVPAQEAGVGYEEGFTLSRIDVVVGDVVQSGDVLAQIQTESTPESIALDIALAEQAVAEAKQSLDEAQIAYDRIQLTASQATIDTLYAEMILARQTVENAQEAYEKVANRPSDDVERAQLLSNLSTAQVNYNSKIANYNAAISTGNEIDQDVALSDLNVAFATLTNAEEELETVIGKKTFDELRSPIDGVVTKIHVAIGESVSANSIVTIANLDQIFLEVFLDETDLDKVAIGNEVEVLFDAYPNELFEGEVIGLDPSLQTVQNVTTVVATVQLTSHGENLTFPIGMQATVDVISGQAENAILVPIEALREIGPNEYIVFVMEEGEPRVRAVVVGLIDFTSAEIISGLELGEIVTTGLVETE